MRSYGTKGQTRGPADAPQATGERKSQRPGAAAVSTHHGLLRDAGPVFPMADRVHSAAASEASAGVIQRVALTDLFTKLKPSLTQLGKLSKWLTARAGHDVNVWDEFLSEMTEQEVLVSMELYHQRVQVESVVTTLDDIIQQGGILQTPPGEQVDKLMLSSPHIGTYAAKRASEGIKVTGAIVVLNDSAFAAQHWEDFLAANQALLKGKSKAVVEALRLREARRIDRVDGFQSNRDGKIYMREGKQGFHIAVHESVHKYGGHSFAAVMGHLLNEGATEYITMLVCAQIGTEIDVAYYPGEKKLLMDVLKVLKISDDQLFAAYFNDGVMEILEKLTSHIGLGRAREFRKARDVSTAATIFNTGQKEVAALKVSS